VVQEVQGKNILPAKKYGEFKFILPYGQVPMDASATVYAMGLNMTTITRDDYVLAIGDPIAIGIACALACKFTGGDFNILKWDRQERIYHPWRIKV
jgi:hypothetical protein